MAIDWAALASTRRRQCELLTRRQCLAAGMTEHALRWRVSSGRWLRMHAGVFLTRPGRDDWLTTAVAALLAAQSGSNAADAALRGRSAGHLWGLFARPEGMVHLVVPQRRSVRLGDAVTVRRSMRWDDLVHERAYPWRTTVAATVLDIGVDGTAVDALSIVARAVQKELVTTAELRRELTARGGHRFSRELKPALADVDDGLESGAEVLYVRDVERAHGLPIARRQTSGERARHDNEYDRWRLIVEVDGRLGHESWSDRVRDGRRDRRVLGTDKAVTRVFFADVAVTPCRTAAEVASILRTRGWRGAPRRCRRVSCVVGAPEFAQIPR
jgi:hypothetical protein